MSEDYIKFHLQLNKELINHLKNSKKTKTRTSTTRVFENADVQQEQRVENDNENAENTEQKGMHALNEVVSSGTKRRRSRSRSCSSIYSSSSSDGSNF